MKRSKLLLGAAVTAIACASGAAHAARVFVGVGGPMYYPVVPAPYYYGPPAVIVAPPPAPDYIEQDPSQSAPAQSGAQGPMGTSQGDTWYYCEASKTYYPYVKECESGWRAVPAQPAPAQ